MADFESRREELDAAGVQVVAASGDAEDGTRRLVRDLRLGLTMIYGLDVASTAAAIGCYTGERDRVPHFQPAAFIVESDGRVGYAVYSSGRAGRLTADDALDVMPGSGAPDGSARG